MRRGLRRLGFGLIILLLLAYIYRAAIRPLPVILPTKTTASLSIQTTPAKFNWPAKGSAAVGLVGSDLIFANGQTTPAPTASTAKMITALCVLHAKPLAAGQQGPAISLGPNDVAFYNSYQAEGGSVVPVTDGEIISEYQMLEAMLLPSANNMADSLASWAYGSLGDYSSFANNYLHQLGLGQTHVGSDASGFDPSTTSTASDLAKIGELVMQNPVLAGIVNHASATGIPETTMVKNVNYLLGSHNIIGIKTGNTDQAGGVFVSASQVLINHKSQVVVTAVMGAPDLGSALSSSVPLIDSAQANFQPVNVIAKGAVVGHYRVPWDGDVPATASQDLAVATWRGSSVPATIKLDSINAGTINTSVGRVTTSAFGKSASVTVTLLKAVPQPSLWWRLSHPF